MFRTKKSINLKVELDLDTFPKSSKCRKGNIRKSQKKLHPPNPSTFSVTLPYLPEPRRKIYILVFQGAGHYTDGAGAYWDQMYVLSIMMIISFFKVG